MEQIPDEKKNGRLPWIWPVFLLLLLLPAYAWLFDGAFALQGVTQMTAAPEYTVERLISGEAQSDTEKAYAAAMPGRNILIRTRNQIMYSILRTSSNRNVVMGEDGNLFEQAYLRQSLGLNVPISKKEMQKLFSKLENLQGLLWAENKSLFIFLTPSKARYVQAPAAWRFLQAQTEGAAENVDHDYQLFKKLAKKSSLYIYDSIEYIDKHQDEFDFPLFYKSGIHWSNALGHTVGVNFGRWLAKQTNKDLNKYNVTMEPTDEPREPDKDLLLTLNVFAGIPEDYLMPVVKRGHKGADHPNAFLRGGSFMGQSLFALDGNKAFGTDVHFENSFFFTNGYSDLRQLSRRDAYDEIEDLPELLADKEIFILEVNETMFRNMSFGFIDYLLAHPEYLHSPANDE